MEVPEKYTEDELLERVYCVFKELLTVEFVEEVNRCLGTDYTIDDVIWRD